ncbi:MAG: 2OG-Fe(II) oxygenase [Ectothiorhodospiraceae bacterium]|nr:2OG-Fe(II) oxygenase [Ectothiorhodospiraceae bacterium]
MQFIGEYKIAPELCESLIALHKAGAKQGLVVRGKLGTREGVVVDKKKKDSYDLGLITVPDALAEHHRLPEFYQALKACVDQYVEQFPIIRQLGAYHIGESPIIQRYKRGGGYRLPHCERTSLETSSRMLVWMAYLNDVTGGGTRFVYQKQTMEATKGRLLIWPPDFTHTHHGVVSNAGEKFIITGWLNFSE